jgi:steroid delta-isomerase-like uncharacterized protein
MPQAVECVRQFLTAENRRDWQQWASFLHTDVTYEVVGSSRVVQGREPYIHHMQQVYAELVDWSFDLLHIVGDDHTVIVEFDGYGHFTGTYEGQLCKDVPLKLNAICVFEIKDDLIHKVREYVDSIGYTRQMEQGCIHEG